MARCKSHPYSSSPGVCAPCLRERLSALASLQNPHSSPPPSPPLPRVPSSGGPRHPPSLLFFRTPQVGPSSLSLDLDQEGSIASLRKNHSRKFSLISTLFGKKSERNDGSDSVKSKAGSWISNLVHRSRRSKAGLSDQDLRSPADVTARRSCIDRGLSPDRNFYTEESTSVSVSDSPWRPAPSPMRRSSAAGHRRRHVAASGFTVCLSPLVRPSPAHRRSQAGEVGFSGDLRSPVHHRHVSVGGGSVGPALCHNRSRKIADVGTGRLR